MVKDSVIGPLSKVYARINFSAYFHNGAAANLHELVNFYNLRFQMSLNDEQKEALVAFLNSL